MDRFTRRDLARAAAAALAMPGAAEFRPFFQKGVNFTAEWPGGYGSDGSASVLDSLLKYGVNAIALVPYGFAPRNSPTVRMPGERGMERDSGVAETARLAKQRGMRVLLKPQVWSHGGFPGDLEFPDPAERAQWFASYRAFADHYARLAAAIRADLYCVGTEFVKLSPFEKEWRALIASSRALYSGPLVYAATQGVEFESAAFWDALDYIGLNNYYPLPDSLDCSEMMRKVEAVQKRFRKPIILTEAGFASVEGSNREPWAEPRRSPALDHQARCYEALLKAFWDKPWFRGVYWWKVGTNGFGGASDTSHTPWGKPAMEVVKRWYTSGRR